MKVKIKALRDLHLAEFGVNVKEGETTELDVNDTQLQNLINTHTIEVYEPEEKAVKKKEKKKEVA